MEQNKYIRFLIPAVSIDTAICRKIKFMNLLNAKVCNLRL